MAKSTLISKPPTGWQRWLFRLPIVLYRLGLGGLLGGRFMLINHTGRKSGLARQTVVEVAGHDESSNTYYVASGWGYKSNWYRNLMAQPDTTIQVGQRTLSVHAENLAPEQGAPVLLDYRQRHPMAANQLAKVMGLDIAAASDEDLVTMVRDSLPIVAFHPSDTA